MRTARSVVTAGLLMLLGAGLQAGCGEGLPSEPQEPQEAPSGSPPARQLQGLAAMAPLSTVPVPQPVSGDIINQDAAVVLGKVFFWEAQAGSDGQTACASCHFFAGADTRRFNTMNPGPNQAWQSNNVTGPGQTATVRNIGSDDRLGSQGVTKADFTGINLDPAVAADVCTANPGAPFNNQRQVTDRNAPSVVGAVFFRQNFWDGRAHHTFNGIDPFGTTGNAGAGQPVSIGNGSLASQAVGPPTNGVEMSCQGRPFNGSGSLGAKLLARPPLQFQQVDPADSVLGNLSAAPGNGLRCGGAPCTYAGLIEAAFGPALAADAQAQFARIWGQAIQAYEATLIPDQTPLDRFLAGDTSALTTQQQQGLNLFTGKGRCNACHEGPELSDATIGFAQANGLINEDGGDQGFHHIGVRPVSATSAEDLGRASRGPSGVSYSVSGSTVDRGAFKTPQLRNVKLTPPYFHNGGKATLTDVVNFYARGGDFGNPSRRIGRINFQNGEPAALVAFLTDGLTDCRTEKEKRPFDHPALTVPNGPTLAAVGASGTGSCPGMDNVRPATAVTSPTEDSTLEGAVAVTASASDNVQVTKVEFFVDGALLGTASAAPYAVDWSTAAASIGNHILTAKAYDPTGNIGVSAPVHVTVRASTGGGADGGVDAGTDTGGSPSDGGMPADGGSNPSGDPDGGPGGGTGDGPDAGTDIPPPQDTGCGCGTTETVPALLSMAFVWAGLWRRRRPPE